MNSVLNTKNLTLFILRFLNVNLCKHRDCILLLTVSKVSRSVSIFGQTSGYRIYTVGIVPVRLLEIQYPVFDIQ